MRHYLQIILLILRKHKKYRFKLIYACIKIVVNAIIYHKIQRHFKQQTFFRKRLLGFDISFFNYPALLQLFEEIFVEETYAFDSVSPSPFIIDCGSNIGMSVFYFKMKYPQCNILCFEPDKKIFETLEHNVTVNRLTGIVLKNCAVAGERGERVFFEASQKEGSLSNSLFEIPIHQSSSMIKTERLSAYISDEVDFLKLDIEGAEGEVIRELYIENKMEHVKQICFEYHKHATLSLKEVKELLQQSGFETDGVANDLSGVTEVIISVRKL